MKERSLTLDISKGIGMILVIYCHSMPTRFYNFFASYHMPLFFLISGCVEAASSRKNLTFIPYLKKSFKGLMLPYFIMGG